MKNPYSLLPWSVKPSYQKGKFLFFDAKGDHIFTAKGCNTLSDAECIQNSANMKPALIDIILLQTEIIHALQKGETKIETKHYGLQELDNLIPYVERMFDKVVSSGVEY